MNKNTQNEIVVCLITTKNRESFFDTLKSVMLQSRKPDCLVVISDSDENAVSREQSATEKACGIYLRERHNHEHNYAGSLNMGIDYIVENFVIERKLDPNQIYVATLDDDDIWHEDYLNECCNALSGSPDFVLSGLNYYTSNDMKSLPIVNDLSIHHFLQGNPGIQGSNTFVKLSTLLKAGWFDETMPSTTDRDIFVRIMQQNPRYTTVNKYLTDIHAESDNRITTNKDKKIDGLRKFYRKYRPLMTDDDERKFHQRNHSLFSIEQEDVQTIQPSENIEQPEQTLRYYNGRLVIGIIVTYEYGAMRLLQQLGDTLKNGDKIVLLNNAGTKLEWVKTISDELQGYIEFVPCSKEKMSIAESRSILQEYIYYNIWKKGDVCWLLDDDMELKQLYHDNHEQTLDIRTEIPLYQNRHDAVIGGYTNDAPVPIMSTFQLQLLDYCFSKGNTTKPSPSLPQSFPDNYYSLSDAGYKHLEYPVYDENISLEKIFQGYTQTRKLVYHQVNIAEARNRGGNTLIFNKDLLLLPTCSLKIRDIVARRGDYFWVLAAKNLKYKICSGTFCTYHNREKKDFNYKQEMDKQMKDIIGSSMTKAFERTNLSQEDLDGEKKIISIYQQELRKRLSHFVRSYYRIMGLLNIAGDTKYKTLFSEDSLKYFCRTIMDYSEPSLIDAAFRNVLKDLNMSKNKIRLPEYKKLLCEFLGIDNGGLSFLGQGNEGCVYHYNDHVYKLFYDKCVKIDNLTALSKVFCGCKYLYPLASHTYKDYKILSYDYEKKLEWKQPKAKDFVDLLHFGKDHGFCFSNLKPENFIITEDGLRYIDYGKDIVPFDEKLFERSIERSYQVFRYFFLNDTEFKELISRSYSGDTEDINFGMDVYKRMFRETYKEDIHDTKVISTIKKLTPSKILDYGAGKCKIANQLFNDGYTVDVYDINVKQMQERATKGIGILEHPTQIKKNAYDVVNCNQVLCWVEDYTVFSILHNISHSLKPNGYLVLSICNPFFTDIQHTMLRGCGRQNTYYDNSYFQEYTSKMKPIDGMEYHRPVEWYKHALRKYGFDIIHSYETDGINTDNALAIGEHLVFVCQKKGEYVELQDLSLMIKTCAMDASIIYNSIRHIVLQLEYGCGFKERIVCVDGERLSKGKAKERTRSFSTDNFQKLSKELWRAKNNGLVDRIIWPDEIDYSVFQTYFAQPSTSAHSQNGQPLLMTLNGFENIQTPFVFQTDCDILFYNNKCGLFSETFANFKTTNACSMSLSICHTQDGPIEYGHRIEVRNCFLNLSLLHQFLPLENSIENGHFSLTWHRSLDRSILSNPELSLRCHNKDLFFIHIENQYKNDQDMMATVYHAVESGFIPSIQVERVNLTGTREEWIPKTDAPIIVVSRGKNTPTDKVKRMIDSLSTQTRKDFAIIYTDANSTNSSEEYASFRLKYNKDFKKAIFIPNKTEHLEIDMLIRAVHSITNEKAIIILVDNDDCLLRSDAIQLIVERFENGSDYVCGNNIRYDKPLKKYHISSFDKLWERNGDNIWLHPICFTKELFDKVHPDDMKIDDDWINICTDFAYAIPMIQLSKKPTWIEKTIYFFEPSIANQKKEGKYNINEVNKMRNFILQKAKNRYEKDHSNYRR